LATVTKVFVGQTVYNLYWQLCTVGQRKNRGGVVEAKKKLGSLVTVVRYDISKTLRDGIFSIADLESTGHTHI